MNELNWSQKAKHTVTPIKHFLSRLSIVVRGDQFNFFKKLLHPGSGDTVLDVGATSDETLKDSNIFFRLYPHSKNLTAATIEDAKKLRLIYPKIKVRKITPGKPLPFNDKQFDIVTSWATLEHVGSHKQQQFFLKELLRVGKKIFVTTPYRGCPYEPHTGFWFLHWLPLDWFRWICRRSGQDFLSQEANLNPLFVSDIRAMLPRSARVKVSVYRTLNLLPTHLLIYSIDK